MLAGTRFATPSRRSRFRIRNSIRHIACAVLLAGLVGTGAATDLRAGSSSGVVVGATVRAYARLLDADLPATVVVTDADIERGFVEIVESSEIEVRTNSRRGYVLELRTDGDLPLILTEIEGLGATRTLGPQGGSVNRTTRGYTTERLALTWRLHLGAEAAPGTYAWPFRLTVRPE